jgi:hypothetical protein
VHSTDPVFARDAAYHLEFFLPFLRILPCVDSMKTDFPALLLQPEDPIRMLGDIVSGSPILRRFAFRGAPGAILERDEEKSRLQLFFRLGEPSPAGTRNPEGAPRGPGEGTGGLARFSSTGRGPSYDPAPSGISGQWIDKRNRTLSGRT